MMVQLELVIQWVSAECIFDPVSTVLVLKSIFDLVSLRKLSPRMRDCVNDDTTIAGVGHTFQLECMSIWKVPNVVTVRPMAPRR